MLTKLGLILALALPFVSVGCATGRSTAGVRLNQIQVIGSHNSYHLRAHPSLRALLMRRNPEVVPGLDYSHRPLPEQLAQLGIRQIELDCLADPEGGLYAHPKGAAASVAAGLPAVPNHDPDGVLLKPGIKIMHVPDIDYLTTALTLQAALQQVRTWSEQHPNHVPIFILLELKDDPDSPDLTQPIRFNQEQLAALEKEITAVIPRRKILTPDDVRRGQPSLPAALRKYGWPKLDSVRGKLFFGLDNEGALRDQYLEEHPALQGRLLFVSVPRSHPAAAWMKMNDPIRDFDQIQALVRDGFLVRTRADADTRQARANDPTQRDKALASGAQFVSTDYPEPNLTLSTYCVRFEDGIVARANPVSGDRKLIGLDLEAGPGR
ncbi:MAG: phosphatidylinositol-specific phospholipase C1-like protein [Verrucomicrobiota bacterium]